ncbi:GLUG motif-containing protein [Clostridium tertium]|uniref:GLUG motif-containing protein n=1 Tax=Clostridium tertium TaxID=1559 RepID=UPI0023B2C3F9|nr:GLUG motif-containing protein [Clostridium tertium]
MYKKKGFTLIEVIITLSLVSLLVYLSLPKSNSAKDEIKYSQMDQNQQLLDSTVDQIYDEILASVTTKEQLAVELSLRLEKIDTFKNMKNPFNPDSKGIGVVNYNNANFNDGHAAYLVTSDEVRPDVIPKGVVWLSISLESAKVTNPFEGKDVAPTPDIPAPGETIPQPNLVPILKNGFYEIWYLEHLEYIGTNSTTLSYSYKLMRSLDFTDDSHYVNINNKAKYTNTTGWNPIGTSVGPYTGIFNGNDKYIYNLSINRPSNDNIGLFAETTNQINSLKVFGSITGNNNVGLITGKSSKGTINSCRADGVVTGKNNIGGVVGYNGASADLTKYADLYDNIATANVNGVDYVGGLVGSNAAKLVSGNSTYKGIIKGKNYVGGLAGTITGEFVGNSSSNEVYGDSHTGGLVGRTIFGSKVIIDDSYATGNIYVDSTSSSTGNIGGLIGLVNSADIANCSATGNIKSNVDKTGGLIGSVEASGAETIKYSYAKGNIINTNGYFVGGFIGNINGKSYSVNYCYSTGNITGTAKSSVGGFIGYTAAASVNYSYSIGSVESSGDCMGGFIGKTTATLVSNCYSISTINAKSTIIGGFIGYTTGRVQNCYSTANITSVDPNYAGFIATYTNASPVTDSFYFANGGLTSKYGVYKADSALKTQSTFTNWDFSTIWSINSSINSGYPYLKNNQPR